MNLECEYCGADVPPLPPTPDGEGWVHRCKAINIRKLLLRVERLERILANSPDPAPHHDRYHQPGETCARCIPDEAREMECDTPNPDM